MKKNIENACLICQKQHRKCDINEPCFNCKTRNLLCKRGKRNRIHNYNRKILFQDFESFIEKLMYDIKNDSNLISIFDLYLE